MLSLLCPTSSPTDATSCRRRHQERKQRMLRAWRDGLERQLAAVNAALSTLEQQMERDQPEPSQG